MYRVQLIGDEPLLFSKLDIIKKAIEINKENGYVIKWWGNDAPFCEAVDFLENAGWSIEPC